MEILNNNSCDKDTMINGGFHSFKKYIDSLNETELLDYIDEEFISLLEKHIGNSKSYNIINFLFATINKFSDTTKELINMRLFRLLIMMREKRGDLYISYDLASKVVNYLIDNNMSILGFLLSIDGEYQAKLVMDKKVRKSLLNQVLEPDFKFISADAYSILLVYGEPKFTEVFLKFNMVTLLRFFENDIIIPRYLLSDKALIAKFVMLEDNNFYREMMNIIFKNYYDLYLQITKARDAAYDEKIRSRRVFPTTVFKEMLVDRYFRDVSYNFTRNLEQMIMFIKESHLAIIPRNRLRIYQDIYNLSSLSLQQRRTLYDLLDDGNDYSTLFYEDYRACKDASYNLINQTILKPNQLEENKDKTKKYKVPVYDLLGENFFALVHTTCSLRDNSHIVNWFNDKFSTVSFSLINQDKFQTFEYSADMVMLGFNNINADQVMHVFHSDSYSSNDLGTNYVNEIHTPDGLIRKTNGYNEILYMEYNVINNERITTGCVPISPSYVFAKDYISMADVKTAQKLRIPIVVFHTDLYQSKDTDREKKENRYLISSMIKQLDKHLRVY